MFFFTGKPEENTIIDDHGKGGGGRGGGLHGIITLYCYLVCHWEVYTVHAIYAGV